MKLSFAALTRLVSGQGGGFGQNDGPKKKNTAWKMGPEKVLSEKQKKDLRKVSQIFNANHNDNTR